VGKRKPRDYGTGAVWQDRESGMWRGQLVIDGRRRSVRASTKREVLRKLDALRDEAADSEDDSGAYTVGEWLTRWVEEWAEGSANTEANRRWAITHLAPIQHRTVYLLTTEHVERVLTDKMGEGLSRNSLVRIRTVLAMALDEAMRRRVVDYNVARLARIPKGARHAREGRALTADQAHALLEAAAEDRDEILVVLGLYLGLRPGEVCGLEWQDVDFDAGTVAVVQMRRREPDQSMSFTDPKAGSHRTLSAPRPVMAALERQRTRQKVERMAARDWQDFGLVATTRNGTPIDPSNHRRCVERMAGAAGIFMRPPLTPNELRHTAATNMVDAGLTLSEVADQLGHANERMLTQTYRHKRRGAVGASAVLVDTYGAA
jgi:integrase